MFAVDKNRHVRQIFRPKKSMALCPPRSCLTDANPTYNATATCNSDFRRLVYGAFTPGYLPPTKRYPQTRALWDIRALDRCPLL